MKPVAIDTDAFLNAYLAMYYAPDGSAHNDVAMWWRRELAVPGASWNLHFLDDARRCGPAVVDDFGDLVLAGARS